jgi:hypothetical protein
MANPTTYQAANAAIDNQLATGGKQSITDTFQNSVVNPYLKQFQTQIMPKVLGNFSGQSAFGSDKAAQENIALGNLNDSILSAGSSLSLQAGNQANSNILSALGLVPSVTGAPINNAVATLNAGAVPTNESNIGIGNAITASANNNAANANNIKAILASLGIQTTQSTTTVNPGQAGILGNVIGAAGSFAGSQAGSAAIANFFA